MGELFGIHFLAIAYTNSGHQITKAWTIFMLRVSKNRTCKLVCINLAAILATFVQSVALGQDSHSRLSSTIEHIGAGTPVSNSQQGRWNRVVFLAKPRLATGDTDSVPNMFHDIVPKFIVTIMATVEPVPAALPVSRPVTALDSSTPDATSTVTASTQGSSATRYRLAEVGIGHSVQVGKQLVAIEPGNYKSHGVDLSFIERQFLSQSGQHFEEIRSVARTATHLMFDVPAILNRNGIHKDFVMRHLVWIDGQTGTVHALIWLLEKSKSASLAVVESELPRWLQTDRIEDRMIHVDAKEFTLGVPGKHAFALEQMPPGRVVEWTKELLSVAALDRYDVDSMRTLLVGLNNTNRTSK